MLFLFCRLFCPLYRLFKAFFSSNLSFWVAFCSLSFSSSNLSFASFNFSFARPELLIQDLAYPEEDTLFLSGRRVFLYLHRMRFLPSIIFWNSILKSGLKCVAFPYNSKQNSYFGDSFFLVIYEAAASSTSLFEANIEASFL